MKSRLDSLLEMLEQQPFDSFLLYGIALEYMSMNEDEKAEEYFKELLEADPGYVPAYMQYASLKINQNEIEEAKLLLRKGIKLAREKNDRHAVNEMEDLLDELE